MNLYELRDALNHLGNNIYIDPMIFFTLKTRTKVPSYSKKNFQRSIFELFPYLPENCKYHQYRPSLKMSWGTQTIHMTELKTALVSAVEI